MWAEPAAGCLVPAAHRVLDRVGADVHLGMVICGGNTTVADMATWTERFAATPRSVVPCRDDHQPEVPGPHAR